MLPYIAYMDPMGYIPPWAQSFFTGGLLPRSVLGTTAPTTPDAAMESHRRRDVDDDEFGWFGGPWKWKTLVKPSR